MSLVTTPNPATWSTLPKVELHVHFEGSLSADWVLQQAEALQRRLPRPSERLFEFQGLTEFLHLLDWMTGLIDSPERLEQVAYAVAGRFHADGIIYSEVIINPTHWPGWTLDKLIGAVSSGFDRAAADELTDCRLLLSLARHQSEREAHDLVDWLAKRRPPRVVGLSIDGNEATAGRTSHRFAASFARARDLGYGLTAHAGESSGPEGVWDALDILKVDRIDHGVRSVEDPRLVARLSADQVPLNVSVTSNLHLVYPSLPSHPIGALVAAGIPITVNTDDPGLLDITLTQEFALVAQHLNWGEAEAVSVTRNAINAAFCTQAERNQLHRRIDRFAQRSSLQKESSR